MTNFITLADESHVFEGQTILPFLKSFCYETLSYRLPDSHLYAVVLIAFGVFHFMYPRDLFVYVPLSLVGGIKWVYVIGTAFILVGLSFLTNQYVKLTGYLLAALLIFFILSIHVPNYLHAGAKDMRQLALVNILKDTAITGFALHIAAGAHHQHFHLEESD